MEGTEIDASTLIKKSIDPTDNQGRSPEKVEKNYKAFKYGLIVCAIAFIAIAFYLWLS